MTTMNETYQPLIRWVMTFPTALVLTLALLLLMQYLISVEFSPVETESRKPMPTIVMDPPPPVTNHYPQPVRADEPEMPPDTPVWTQPIPGPTLIPEPINHTPEPKDGGPVVLLGGQLMPQVKIQPNYPRRATERGIEGFVEVMFDVTATGATDNIRIVAAEPANLFEQSVIQAVRRWKYNPRYEGDQPVRTENLYERIVFSMAN